MAVMITIACVTLSLVLGDISAQVSVMRAGTQLRRDQAVSFWSYHNATVGHSTVTDKTVQGAIEQIKANKAYTVIMNNVQLEDPDFAGGNDVLVMFGDAPLSVFANLNLCQPAPCGMVGSHVVDPDIGSVDYAGTRIDVSSQLRPGAVFFDPAAGVIPLDDRVVLRLPAQSLLKVSDGLEREEALTWMIMLNPSGADLAEFTRGCAQANLFLAPRFLAVDQPAGFRDMMIMSGIYIVGIGAFLALVLLVFVGIASQTLRQERAAFVIRRQFGSTMRDAATRLASFLGVTMLALPVPILLILMLLGEPFQQGATIMLTGVCATFVLLFAFFSFRLTRRLRIGAGI